MEQKMFGYYVYDRGDKCVGVVKAVDKEEAEVALRKAFLLDDISTMDILEIEFNSDDICEIYYGF